MSDPEFPREMRACLDAVMRSVGILLSEGANTDVLCALRNSGHLATAPRVPTDADLESIAVPFSVGPGISYRRSLLSEFQRRGYLAELPTDRARSALRDIASLCERSDGCSCPQDEGGEALGGEHLADCQVAIGERAREALAELPTVSRQQDPRADHGSSSSGSDTGVSGVATSTAGNAGSSPADQPRSSSSAAGASPRKSDGELGDDQQASPPAADVSSALLFWPPNRQPDHRNIPALSCAVCADNTTWSFYTEMSRGYRCSAHPPMGYTLRSAAPTPPRPYEDVAARFCRMVESGLRTLGCPHDMSEMQGDIEDLIASQVKPAPSPDVRDKELADLRAILCAINIVRAGDQLCGESPQVTMERYRSERDELREKLEAAETECARLRECAHDDPKRREELVALITGSNLGGDAEAVVGFACRMQQAIDAALREEAGE